MPKCQGSKDSRDSRPTSILEHFLEGAIVKLHESVCLEPAVCRGSGIHQAICQNCTLQLPEAADVDIR